MLGYIQMSSFFSKVKSGLSDLFTLGKSLSSSPLLQKAKSWVSSGLDALNNKNTKNIVSALGNYIPQIKDFYAGARKYANIGDQFLNRGGLNKAVERTFPQLGSNLQKFQERIRSRKPGSIELQPREERVNMGSIF
jgi:hypothetical protein